MLRCGSGRRGLPESAPDTPRAHSSSRALGLYRSTFPPRGGAFPGHAPGRTRPPQVDGSGSWDCSGARPRRAAGSGRRAEPQHPGPDAADSQRSASGALTPPSAPDAPLAPCAEESQRKRPRTCSGPGTRTHTIHTHADIHARTSTRARTYAHTPPPPPWSWSESLEGSEVCIPFPPPRPHSASAHALGVYIWPDSGPRARKAQTPPLERTQYTGRRVQGAGPPARLHMHVKGTGEPQQAVTGLWRTSVGSWGRGLLACTGGRAPHSPQSL